jgi:hypothetical protein
MAKTNTTLKIGSPEIRVPLDAAKKPKPSMKVTGAKKTKMKLPKRAKC